MENTKQRLTIKEASNWASDYLKKNISESNISYLVQYGKVKKYFNDNTILIELADLTNYYRSLQGNREISWKERLGKDLNWALSFDHLREKDTTKHIHRLHPYKGKFIPQLVEYFIDDHIDNYKTAVYFKPGDIILDPFSGSGTTLVQANEMGMHSIGIDISSFNCMITEVKLHNYNFLSLENDINHIKKTIGDYETDNQVALFENELTKLITEFNNQFFPGPEYKYKVYQKKIDENQFAKDKEQDFLNVYNQLIKKYHIELNHFSASNFLDRWYIKNVRKEVDYAFEQIKKIKDKKNKKILAVILSRTIRSCRATTHSDLATLKEPQVTTYYCFKHKKSVSLFFPLSLGLTVTRLTL